MQHVRIQGSQLELVRAVGPPVLLPAAGLPHLLPLHAVRATGRPWDHPPAAAVATAAAAAVAPPPQQQQQQPPPPRAPVVSGGPCTICGGAGAVVSMYNEWGAAGPRLPLPEKVWRWCVFLGSPFWSAGGGRLCPPCHALVHCVESLQLEARLLERVAAEAAAEMAATSAGEGLARRFRSAIVASGLGATRALLRSVEGLLAGQEAPRRQPEPPPPPPQQPPPQLQPLPQPQPQLPPHSEPPPPPLPLPPPQPLLAQPQPAVQQQQKPQQRFQQHHVEQQRHSQQPPQQNNMQRQRKHQQQQQQVEHQQQQQKEQQQQQQQKQEQEQEQERQEQQQQQQQQQQQLQQYEQQQHFFQSETRDMTTGQEQRRRRASESRSYLQPQLTPLRRGSKRKQKAPCRLPGASVGPESQLEPQSFTLTSPAVITPGSPASGAPGSSTSMAPGSSTSGADTPSVTTYEPLRSAATFGSSDATRASGGRQVDEQAPAMIYSVSITNPPQAEVVPLASHEHVVFGALCTPPMDLSVHQGNAASRGHPPANVLAPPTGWHNSVPPIGELVRDTRLCDAVDSATGASAAAMPDKLADVDLPISSHDDSRSAPVVTVSERSCLPGAVGVTLGARSYNHEDISSIADSAGTGQRADACGSEDVKPLRSSCPLQPISIGDCYSLALPAFYSLAPEKKPAVMCSTNVRPARPIFTAKDKKKRLRKGLKLKIVREDNAWHRRSPAPRESDDVQQVRPVQPGGDGGAACKQQRRQLQQQQQQLLQHTTVPKDISVEEVTCQEYNISAAKSEDEPTVKSEVGTQQTPLADSWHGCSRGRLEFITPTALPGFEPVPVIAPFRSSDDAEASQTAETEGDTTALENASKAQESELNAATGSTSTAEEACDQGFSGRGFFRGGTAAVTAHILPPPYASQQLRATQVRTTEQADASADVSDSGGPVLMAGDGGMERREDEDASPRVTALVSRNKSGPATDDAAGAEWSAAPSPDELPPSTDRPTPGNHNKSSFDAGVAMKLSESALNSAGENLSNTANLADVDINNNVMAGDSGGQLKSTTGTAGGTGPELGHGIGTVGRNFEWITSGEGPRTINSIAEVTGVTGVAAPTQSSLVVDGEIGRVFLSANRALYGCDEHDAAEPHATRPAASDVEVDDEDDGRLFIALPGSPDGRRFVVLNESGSSLVEEKLAGSLAGAGQDLSSADVVGTVVSGPSSRRRIREQDKPLVCDKCGRRFILNKMLENHKCGIMYTCAECGKPFKKRCQLQAHSFIHRQAKDFVCGICQRAFKEKSNFNRHVRTHSSLRPYKCPHCVKCFKVAATLYVHRLTHDARGRFICDFCGKDFKRPEHLRQHRRIHTGEKPYRCTVCQQCFTTDNTLRTHMRRHTGERPYPCPICQKRFTQSSAMKTHWKRHSESREFDCSLCHLKFKQKYDLNRHMVSHNTDRPHQCSLCHLRFKTRSSLQKHRETHSEERQFSCGTCGKTFRRLSYLRLHEATHGVNARFACSLCTKSFTRRYNLRLHQEEHEEGGRRRHFCSTCRRCFRRAAGLRQHLATAHGGPASVTEQGESQQGTEREEHHSGEGGSDRAQVQCESPGEIDVVNVTASEESAAAASDPGLKLEILAGETEGRWMGGVADQLHCRQGISSYSEETLQTVCNQEQRPEENSQERQCEVKRSEDSSEEELIVD